MIVSLLAIVGMFVLSWVFFWFLLVLWALFTGGPIPPIIDNRGRR